MYFFSIDIFIKQLLPPIWRKGEFSMLSALMNPFKVLYSDFNAFRQLSESNINLSAQTMVIESKISDITGLVYGVYVADGVTPNFFTVNVPTTAIAFKPAINQHLKKIVPIGKKYTLIFY